MFLLGSGNDIWSRVSLLDFVFGQIGRDEQPVVLLFSRPGGWLKMFCWLLVGVGKDVDGTGAMLPLSVCVSRGFPVPSSLSGVCTRVCILSFDAVTFVFEEAVDVRARRDGDEDGKLGFSFTVS